MRRQVIWRAALPLAAAALPLGLAPAVAAAHASASPQAPSAVTVKTITVRDFFFSPSGVAIRRGTAVRWVNQGTQDHTTTSNTGLWNRLLAPGTSYTRTFTRVGQFAFHCAIHSSMRGSVKVT